MQKCKKIINNLLPYFLIFVFSLIGTYLVFLKGFNNGDDFVFHFGNILDQYRMLEDGYELNPISGNLGLGFGVGNRLFYSPLTHFVVTLIYRLIDVFNGSVIIAEAINEANLLLLVKCIINRYINTPEINTESTINNSTAIITEPLKTSINL